MEEKGTMKKTVSTSVVDERDTLHQSAPLTILGRSDPIKNDKKPITRAVLKFKFDTEEKNPKKMNLIKDLMDPWK